MRHPFCVKKNVEHEEEPEDHLERGEHRVRWDKAGKRTTVDDKPYLGAGFEGPEGTGFEDDLIPLT